MAKMLYIPRVLIIGAGPTCGLIVNNIMKTPNLSKVLNLWVWEKAKGVGGRFSTLRSNSNPKCYLDLGTQYLEQSSLTNELTNPYFEELVKDGLLREIDEKAISGYKRDAETTKLFAPTQGTSKIVRNYFNKAGIKHKLEFRNYVNEMKIVDLMGSPKIQVCTHDGEKEIFDIVITTIPPPRLLQLKGLDTILPKDEKSNIISNLEAVKYSSRFTIGALFDKPIPLKEDDFGINYSNGSATVRLWTYENLKRTGSYKTKEPFALTAHTAAGYEPNFPYLDDYEFKHNLYTEIVKSVKYLQDEDNVPTRAKVHFWKYSQVLNPYIEKPGFIILRKDPLILAGGDGFTYSSFGGCIESATKIVKYLSSKFPEVIPVDDDEESKKCFYRKPALFSDRSNKVIMK